MSKCILNHTNGRSYIDVIKFLEDKTVSYKTSRGYNYTIVSLLDEHEALYLKLCW